MEGRRGGGVEGQRSGAEASFGPGAPYARFRECGYFQPDIAIWHHCSYLARAMANHMHTIVVHTTGPQHAAALPAEHLYHFGPPASRKALGGLQGQAPAPPPQRWLWILRTCTGTCSSPGTYQPAPLDCWDLMGSGTYTPPSTPLPSPQASKSARCHPSHVQALQQG